MDDSAWLMAQEPRGRLSAFFTAGSAFTAGMPKFSFDKQSVIKNSPERHDKCFGTIRAFF
jgi:hypothetical protein